MTTKQPITLATLHLATKQEVFEQVAKHLLKQNAKSGVLASYEDGETLLCKYRAPNGLSCAAGCLIAEDEYHPNFEGKSWFGLTDPTNDYNITDTHDKLINALQDIHDNHAVYNWPTLLTKLAERLKLDYSFITV